MKKLKRIGAIILVLSTLLFILTNTESAPVTVIYRDFEMPLILVMSVPLLIGFILGLYVARNMGKDKAAKSKEAAQASIPDPNKS